jgi:hypothetical protein
MQIRENMVKKPLNSTIARMLPDSGTHRRRNARSLRKLIITGSGPHGLLMFPAPRQLKIPSRISGIGPAA